MKRQRDAYFYSKPHQIGTNHVSIILILALKGLWSSACRSNGPLPFLNHLWRWWKPSCLWKSQLRHFHFIRFPLVFAHAFLMEALWKNSAPGHPDKKCKHFCCYSSCLVKPDQRNSSLTFILPNLCYGLPPSLILSNKNDLLSPSQIKIEQTEQQVNQKWNHFPYQTWNLKNIFQHIFKLLGYAILKGHSRTQIWTGLTATASFWEL